MWRRKRREEKIRYIRTHELLASDAESARTYYHYASDEMGSITHVTAENEILNRYEYDAWGNAEVCEEQVANRFRFNAQQYDPVSQQYYLRARFYNPVIARFTQEDTYRGDGLNLYAYCRNNPVYYVDPSGHEVCPPGVDRISSAVDSRTATRDEYKRLSNHLREKMREGQQLTPAEMDAANKLGLDSRNVNTPELKVVDTYDNNNYFTRAVEFNAGSTGTGFTYKVYQRNDIDWDMVRVTGAKKGRGLTNAQAAAKYGLAPILNDGYIATLHHSQQRSVGPLFEASTRYHNISNAKKAPLHPYKGQLNPFSPMDSTTRSLFQSVDSIQYWKARGRDAIKGGQ